MSKQTEYQAAIQDAVTALAKLDDPSGQIRYLPVKRAIEIVKNLDTGR